MNRQDYLSNRVTFAEYYTSVAKAAGIKLSDPTLLDRVRKALAAGDEHLNTIPLATWDSYALFAKAALQRGFKQHEDFYSLAGGVCVFKQAAINAVNTREPDFTVQNEGTIFILWAHTDAAKQWAAEHLPADAQTWGVNGTAIEHGYIADIVDGIKRDGLTIK